MLYLTYLTYSYIVLVDLFFLNIYPFCLKFKYLINCILLSFEFLPFLYYHPLFIPKTVDFSFFPCLFYQRFVNLISLL